MLILGDDQIRGVLQMPELIPAMRYALAALSSGDASQPLRTMLPIPEQDGCFWTMPGRVGSVLGTKLVTLFPHNEGMHTHHALVALFDPTTGVPLAVMDGRLLTEMRTAATSAVATQLLSRSDASVLGILGSGVQARSHLEALRLVRPFREVRVWSPRNGAAFAERWGVQHATSAEAAVAGADVVVVATTARHPVLKGEWLKAGTHVNAVGAARADWRELDDTLLARATLFVESREAASRESGDVIAAGKIHAEIGEVINGMKEGRRTRDEVTLFKSVGVAVEDLACADLVYRAAVNHAKSAPSGTTL